MEQTSFGFVGVRMYGAFDKMENDMYFQRLLMEFSIKPESFSGTLFSIGRSNSA